MVISVLVVAHSSEDPSESCLRQVLRGVEDRTAAHRVVARSSQRLGSPASGPVAYRILATANAATINPSAISAHSDSAGMLAGSPTATAAAPPLELPPFGSLVALETLAELVIGPVAFGATVRLRVNVAVPPLASVAPLQVIVPVVPAGGVVQVKPGGATIDPNRSDAGSGSVITTFDAASGPLLCTVMV